MANEPLCSCHNIPMFWHKDATRSGGGRWRCRRRKGEYNGRYDHSSKGRLRNGARDFRRREARRKELIAHSKILGEDRG